MKNLICFNWKVGERVLYMGLEDGVKAEGENEGEKYEKKGLMAPDSKDVVYLKENKENLKEFRLMKIEERRKFADLFKRSLVSDLEELKRGKFKENVEAQKKIDRISALIEANFLGLPAEAGHKEIDGAVKFANDALNGLGVKPRIRDIWDMDLDTPVSFDGYFKLIRVGGAKSSGGQNYKYNPLD